MAARARWADETATRLLRSGGLPAPPPIPEASPNLEFAHGATAALRADQALQHEIDNVVGATK